MDNGLHDALSVLLIEDNPGDARLVRELLRDGEQAVDLCWESTLADGLETLRTTAVETVLLDLGLPGCEGVRALEHCVAAAPAVPVVVLTGQRGLDVAMRAMEGGATEYLRKDELSPGLLGRTVRWAVERKQMETELRTREKWIRSITENITGGLFRSTPDGELVYTNAGFAEILGYESRERLVKGQDIEVGTDAEHLQDLSDILRDNADGQREIRITRLDGTVVEGLLSSTAVRDEQGGVKYYDGVFTDITQRKEREEKLQLLWEVVEQANDAVLVTDAAPVDGPGPRIVYANPSFEEMSGYTAEELRGESPELLRGPDTDPDVIQRLHDCLRRGTSFKGETVNYRKDGTPYVVQWTVSPVRDDEGTIQYWASIQRNVTDRRRRERKLWQSRRRFTATFEDPNILHGLLAPDGTVIEVNETARGYLPSGADPAKDQPFWALPWWSQGREGDVREWVRRAAEEEYVAFEADLRSREAPVAVQGVMRPVTDREGTVVSILVSARDVTGQKRRERELQQAKQEAEEANRLKSAFLANMSHEIRTPLTSILGFAEVIGDEVSDLKDGVESVDLNVLGHYSRLIERAGRRLMDTLTAVLDLSKLEAGEMEMCLETIDLVDAVTDVVETLAPQAADANIGLQVELGADTVLAQADDGGVQIIANNLISNAIKYTEEGGTVWVRTWEEREGTAIEVEDTGIGMEPEAVTELFEPFSQASTGMGRSYEGSGLGLALMRRVVRQMDGTVEVETAPGEGTRFTVWLPKAGRTPDQARMCWSREQAEPPHDGSRSVGDSRMAR